MSFFNFSEQIDDKIEDVIGRKAKKRLIVHTAELPTYRFVDLFNSISSFLEGRPRVDVVETHQNNETLNQLIHDKSPDWSDRSVRRAPKISWPTAVDESSYLPVDCFWLVPSGDIQTCFVLRLSHDEYTQKAKLEIACGDTDAGQKALDEIVEHSRVHSIYRNAILHLSYDAARKDEYGDLEKPERFQISFSSAEPVTDKDIVLSDAHTEVLQRNVIDLHKRRAILEANGIPTRRGVLLHGPPGTGKTFACRYLCNELPDVTRMFVTGSSLLNVDAIFSFARLMQPSLLFLEDVDLIFASREINLYSTALGDLLDQLDGLRPHENICVIMTTNAIDRMEAAIKDRPGRISQCVYMGAPSAYQRDRFLQHQLAAHDASELDFEQLVAQTDGATQAFLKEWCFRAIQIACERLDEADQRVQLQNTDFLTAYDEMARFLDGSDGRIIGFVARQ